MSIELEKEGKIGLLKVSGRLDAANAKEMKNQFRSYLGLHKYFVMDCSELNFIDSTGLGSIISALKSATEIGGDIYIAALQDKPRMLFEITRAYKIFEVFDDVETAIKALEQEMV